MVKGLLSYNGNKSLEFEKEIVFPSNSTAGMVGSELE